MPLNRRQFIASTSASAAGTLLATAASFAASPTFLTTAEIQSNEDLRVVHAAVEGYGHSVRMSRTGDDVRVHARIRDLSAFQSCYSAPKFSDSPVRVPSGNRLEFTRNRIAFVVDHAI